MSHFTHIKTRFHNLSYLEKALNLLNISYTKEKKILHSSTLYNESLIISQSNGYNIEFEWNNREYELIVDMSFWEQPSTVESFIDKIAQQYASEVVIQESQKLGFQTVQSNQNTDGSTTLVLERWRG